MRVLRFCIVGVVVLMLCTRGDSSLASRRDEGTGADPLGVTGADYRVYLPGVFQAYRAPEGRIRLTSDGADEMQPALSPDGDAVAYVRIDGGQSDVYLLSLISGATVRLTNTPGANEETPIFSPDGVWIVFASDRTGDWDIYRARRDGTRLEAIIAQPETAEQHPAFMPDGQRLAFSWSATGGGDIYTGEMGSAERELGAVDEPSGSGSVPDRDRRRGAHRIPQRAGWEQRSLSHGRRWRARPTTDHRSRL